MSECGGINWCYVPGLDSAKIESAAPPIGQPPLRCVWETAQHQADVEKT